MIRSIAFSSILLLAFLSCTKKEHLQVIQSASLAGSWRMITVQDHSSGTESVKPASLAGDVVITFTAAAAGQGTFTGNTPTNIISQNEYSIGANKAMHIPELLMTKTMETDWGGKFVTHIRDTREYAFDNAGLLHIKTAEVELVFVKLS